MEKDTQFLIIKILGYTFLVGMTLLFIFYSKNISFDVEITKDFISTSNQSGQMNFYHGSTSHIDGIAYQYIDYKDLREGGGADAMVIYFNSVDYDYLLMQYNSIEDCPQDLIERKVQKARLVTDNKRLIAKTYFETGQKFSLTGKTLIFAGGKYKGEEIPENYYKRNESFFFVEEREEAGL